MASTLSSRASEDRIMRDDNAPQSKDRIRSVADDFTAKRDWQTLPSRLQGLVEAVRSWEGEGAPQLTYNFSSDPKESTRLAITAAVMVSAHKSLVPSFQALFRASLQEKARQSREDNNDSMDAEEKENDLFANGKDLAMFDNLRFLGWIRNAGMLMPALGAALHRAILNHVKTTIAGDFEEEGFFEDIQQWCQATVEVWLHDLLGPTAFEEDEWSSRLQFCAAQCFCLVRIEEIFDIICDWESSRPAVKELQRVLEKTQMYKELGDAVRASLVRRLNHPGANTSQIIDCYINTIKVLREIDPSDRLLEVVTEPVRSYLRGRNDTVRCIITR